MIGTDQPDPSAGGTNWPGWSVPLQAVRDVTSVAPGDTDPTAVDTDPGQVVLAATEISLSHETLGWWLLI
jgi:hypothetical protein